MWSDCSAVIDLFEQCHDDHPIAKFMGVCNDLKRQLTLCLRAEVAFIFMVLMMQRKMNQKINSQKAAIRRSSVEKAWKEIDENS